MILVVDNYDSFTFNLVQYLGELAGPEEIRVRRNDAAGVAELLAEEPRAIVLSPGPGVPESAGVCVELIRRASGVPILGVCLGHQAVAVAYGGQVVAAPEPRHGKVSPVAHGGRGIFSDLPSPIEATRYHSLVVRRDTLPAELRVSAWTEDGLVMGLEHGERPHHGVQFHPESYLTREGKYIVANFLRLAGIETGDWVPGTGQRPPARSASPRPAKTGESEEGRGERETSSARRSAEPGGRRPGWLVGGQGRGGR